MSTTPSRLLIAVSLLALAVPGVAFPKDVDPTPDVEAHEAAAYGDLPVSFELNVGQSDERVSFLSRASGARVFLTPDELVLALPRSSPAIGKRTPEDLAPEPLAPAVVRMRLVGASPSTPVGEDEIETKTNYFTGNDPSRWHTDVPNFARVRYPDVYPGVDLVLYGNHGTLEYDLALAPGADPSVISVVWEGADSVEADTSGALVMTVDGGQLRQHAPALYQHSDEAERSSVAGRFVSRGGGRFGLDVGAYDHGKPLVVDPAITYSTFLGSGSSDSGEDIAVDATGAAYIVGSTFASDFPIYLGYDSSYNGYIDAFVTKLNKAGNALIYSTYLGGSNYDGANCGAVDASGTITVAGSTYSSDLPTTDGYDATLNGASDAFVARLGAQGNSLVAATYLGGSSNSLDSDIANAIALDPKGNAYVAGLTRSTDFPTTANAYDSTLNGYRDGTVTKLVLKQAPPTSYISYSTYLGRGGDEFLSGIVVDSTGAAYVTGNTTSSDFPTVDGFDTSFNGEVDAFVAKLSPQGDALLNSTFLGGNSLDWGRGIAMDAAGAVYVTGDTESLNFPVTANSYDTTFNGGLVDPTYDAFVAKFHVRTLGTFSSLVLDYCTFIGGSDGDYASDIALDSDGNALIAGYSRSADFPLANAVDAVHAGYSDAFVAKLNPAGDGLVYSTYLGGSGSDSGKATAVDSKGSACVTGSTTSSDFPLVNAFDTTRQGTDAFVAKIQR